MSCFVDILGSMKHDIEHLDRFDPGSNAAGNVDLSALEEILSQHPHSFQADTAAEVSGDVTRMARQVLSILARPEAQHLTWKDQQPTLLTDKAAHCVQAVAGLLYETSFCPDKDRFNRALADAQLAGCSTDQLAFELIPGIARQLGAAWEDDLISFADVTIGCARLQSALRHLPDILPDKPETHRGIERNCLVMTLPHAQHTLGALVLAKQLRQARQRVHVELESHPDAWSHPALDQDFDVIMISASRSECPVALQSLVGLCRQNWGRSRVVIGGSFCDLGEDVKASVQADQLTMDWQEALNIRI